MPRYGMVIDLDRCTACQACVVACKVENNVPFASPEETAQGRDIAWIQLLPGVEGAFPEAQARFRPVLCMHCDVPPCVPVCPTGATYTSAPTGIVAQIYPRCIGCRYCANACPFTIKFFNWSEPAWPAPMDRGHNPDVSLRPKGVVEKCTFCHHRLQQARERAAAEGRPLAETDYTTACQEACPTRAISFGDLDDPSGRVAGLVRSPRAFRLLEDLGTEPKVYYLKEGEWDAGRRA